MSTPEDRLAALLRATETDVRGDGLARIRARVVRRKRTRLVLVPLAALAVVGLVATAALSVDRDPKTSLIPGGTPSVSAGATAQPSPTASSSPCPALGRCPQPTPSGTYAAGETYLWPPFQADRSVEPWRTDPEQVARRFATTFLRLGGLTVAGDSVPQSAGTGRNYRLLMGDREVALMDVEPLGGGPRFVVTQVIAPGASLTSPGFGELVTSPLTVTGTLDQGVDENVRLTLIAEDGREIAQGGAPAGSEVPWSGTLTWTDTSWTHGALVGQTFSPKDGALTRLLVTPVSRSGNATAEESFVVIDRGHVSRRSLTTSDELRQLTFPPAGHSDLAVTAAGATVVWVRDGGTTCTSSLLRLDGTAASTEVPEGTVQLTDPRLSPDGRRLGWVQQPCGSTAQTIVLRGDGNDRRLPVPRGSAARLLDVADDGALLIQLHDANGTGPGTVALLPAGATELSGLVPLAASGSCFLTAASFDNAPTAWESCHDQVRLVRYASTGERQDATPFVPDVRRVLTADARDGSQLVTLTDRDGFPVVASFTHGTLAFLSRCQPPTNDLCAGPPSW